MDNEQAVVQVVEAEIISPPATQFQPGNTFGGRPRGSLNHVTRAMKAELAAELEASGHDGNPLVILARIARNLDYHPMIRIQAADRLARYLAPRLMQVDLEIPEASFEVETQKMKAKLRGIFMTGGD